MGFQLSYSLDFILTGGHDFVQMQILHEPQRNEMVLHFLKYVADRGNSNLYFLRRCLSFLEWIFGSSLLSYTLNGIHCLFYYDGNIVYLTLEPISN